jgi:hypothetical protein
MYIKALLARFFIIVAIAGPLLGITSFVSNNIHNYEVFATHMDTATSQETTILHQAIIASSRNPQIEPRPNERLESVVVLPYRADGSIYKGVLTYTATKPVEVIFGHSISIDNTTLSQLDMQKYGKLFVRHLTGNVEGNISATSRIIPDYSGSTSPYFSASIPFVASSVVLRTNEVPFIAAYEVSADIVQPKIIKHLENATTISATNNSTIS